MRSTKDIKLLFKISQALTTYHENMQQVCERIMQDLEERKDL